MGSVLSLRSKSIVDPQTDALIERIEAAGLNVYVMENLALGPFLAFEHGRPPVMPDGVVADAELAARFAEDAALRERMSINAMQMGAYYRAL